MLSFSQESNHITVFYNQAPLIHHNPWRPFATLFLNKNGKTSCVSVKNLIPSQTDDFHIALSCAGLIEITIEEQESILYISCSNLPAGIESLSLRLHVDNNLYLFDYTNTAGKSFRYSRSLKSPGQYLYGTHGFIAGISKGEIKAKKTGRSLVLKMQPERLVLQTHHNFYKSASKIHSVMNKQQKFSLSFSGIYFMGGGGDIALSCKVQELLDNHIPSRGIIFSDLYKNRSAAGTPWNTSYPDLAGEVQCYEKSGMIPCAMLAVGYEENSRQTALHYSQEQFLALKSSGIKYLGLNPDTKMPAYSLRKLGEYAVKNSRQSGFSLGFSYAQLLPVRNTYQLFSLNTQQAALSKIPILCSASYGAFAVGAPLIALSEALWKDIPQFYQAMEFALFCPLLVLDAGSDSNRTIPFLNSPFAKVLTAMLKLHTALMPYHEFCMNNLAVNQAPIHYLPQYNKKQDFTEAFMYGPDLFVGLKQHRHQERTAIELPPGNWIHFWTGISYETGTVIINAPPGYPAVFYKAESNFANLFDSIRRTGKNF